MLTGVPGAGKTYTALKDFVLPALSSGRRVVSNIAGFDINAVSDCFGEHFITGNYIATDGAMLWQSAATTYPTVDDSGVCDDSASFVKAGDLVVVDEVALHSARMARNVPEELRRFLVMHRHLIEERGRALYANRQPQGCDFLFIAQEHASVPSVIKELGERFYHCRSGALMTGAKSGRYFLAVREKWDLKVLPLYSENRRYDKRVFGCYSSHAAAEASDGSAGRTKGALNAKFKFMAACVGLIMIGGLSISGYNIFSAFDNPPAVDVKLINDDEKLPPQPIPPPALPLPVVNVKPAKGYFLWRNTVSPTLNFSRVYDGTDRNN